MSFALSCSWNSFRHNTAKDIIDEITRLGFTTVELDFRLSESMINDIASLVKENTITVASIHNFCPVPDGIERRLALPDYFSLSSPDEDIRRKAVRFTKRTIDTASLLGAKAVVLHCGRVEIEDKMSQLRRLYNLNLRSSGDYSRIKDELIQERQKAIAPYLSSALSSLKELSGYAEDNGIKLGIENRAYYREIPSFEEIGIFLSQMPKDTVYYWHDTGHAQLLENLSLGKHIDHLSEYGDRILGTHLHDVSGTEDHLPPPKGDIDFGILKPYLTSSVIKVIEVHHPATEDEILNASKFLTAVYGPN